MGFVVALVTLLIGYAMAYTGANNLRNGGQGPGFFESLGINGHISSPGNSGGNSQPNAPGYPSNPDSGNGGGFGFPGVPGGILGGPIDYSGNPNVGNAPGYNSSPGQVTEVV